MLDSLCTLKYKSFRNIRLFLSVMNQRKGNLCRDLTYASDCTVGFNCEVQSGDYMILLLYWRYKLVSVLASCEGGEELLEGGSLKVKFSCVMSLDLRPTHNLEY
jgi:hypothetical protein